MSPCRNIICLSVCFGWRVMCVFLMMLRKTRLYITQISESRRTAQTLQQTFNINLRIQQNLGCKCIGALSTVGLKEKYSLNGRFKCFRVHRYKPEFVLFNQKIKFPKFDSDLRIQVKSKISTCSYRLGYTRPLKFKKWMYEMSPSSGGSKQDNSACCFSCCDVQCSFRPKYGKCIRPYSIIVKSHRYARHKISTHGV